MFKKLNYRTDVYQILKSEFDYAPPPALMPVFRSCTNHQYSRGANAYDAAIVFIMVQINALYAPLDKKKQDFIMRHVKSVARIIDRGTDDKSEVRAAFLDVIESKGAGSHLMSEISSLLNFSKDEDGLAIQAGAILQKTKELYEAIKSGKPDIRTNGQTAALAFGVLDAVINYINPKMSDADHLALFTVFLYKHAGFDPSKLQGGSILRAAVEDERYFRERMIGGSSAVEMMHSIE